MKGSLVGSGSPCHTFFWLQITRLNGPYNENTEARAAGSRDTRQLAEGREQRLMGNRETVFLVTGKLPYQGTTHLKNQRSLESRPLLGSQSLDVLCLRTVTVAAVGAEGPNP